MAIKEHIDKTKWWRSNRIFSKFNLENINSLAITKQKFVHTCSTIKNTINSLNDAFKILIFDIEDNYNAFTKEKEN